MNIGWDSIHEHARSPLSISLDMTFIVPISKNHDYTTMCQGPHKETTGILGSQFLMYRKHTEIICICTQAQLYTGNHAVSHKLSDTLKANFMIEFMVTFRFSVLYAVTICSIKLYHISL